MIEVHSKALDTSITIERIIADRNDQPDGPTIIFTGGIHGNEPSGVFALQRVFNQLNDSSIKMKGRAIALAGNMWALPKGVRFDQQDLNRLWTRERMNQLAAGKLTINNEDDRQQLEINQIIEELIRNSKGPLYFVDLHTTSSETVPFLTVNDSLLNRKFTEQYPVPMILGIEEYLDGPLLSWINGLGYVAFGFEGGQHDDLSAIENHEAFIYLSMVYSGVLHEKDIDFNHFYQVLSRNTKSTKDIYEIYFRYEIQDDENFKMEPGYVNFQPLNRGELIAKSNGQHIINTRDSRIFMPLYQNQGSDGFFRIRPIPRFFLALSARLRKWRFDKVLPILPGIHWDGLNHEVLRVNLRVARLLTKRFLHLMGYRSKQQDATHLLARNRESVSRTEDYAKEKWYKAPYQV